MAIKSSVGQKGINFKTDVKLVQAALNLAQTADFILDKDLAVDGRCGNKTIATIKIFQKNIVGMQHPDGRVDPKGATIKMLKKNITKGLSEDALLAIMANGQASTIKTYLKIFNQLSRNYKLNTPLRIAHFLAQVGHESASFNYTKELASGAAYEGRTDLGNCQKGDGVRFKGRGLIQLTGRANYKRYGAYSGLNLLKKGNEELISTVPKNAMEVSMWFWKNRKLNNFSDSDNLLAITRRVNGGYNGLADRQGYLDRAKFFLLPSE
jgi:putative chitinase